MATVSWSQTSVVGSNVVINGSYYTERTPFDILASGETFDVILPSRTLTLVSSVAGNTMYQVSAPKITVTYGSGSTVTRSLGSTYTSPSVAQGTAVALPAVTNNNFRTANLFNSNNPTVAYVDCPMIIDYAGVYFSATANYFSYPNVTIGTARVKLNAPPTYDATDLTFDKSYIYAGLTTASVTVSNTTAYYGGTVESATLTIGNQTATITGDGTLSILLNAGGTFTPTITVTDSRGQTTTKTLDSITVNVYTAPSVSFTVERTTATGMPDDEGTYATVDATFTFADVIADAIAPTVTVTDEDGVQTTPTVTWYSSRGADGTLSGTVTWSSLSSGDTVYGLIPNLNTEFSWQIAITPKDSEGTGTPITQTLAGAFYTIDFLAGGHGIAFGKPAINTGFECAMDATFEDTLTAQDMTAQEVDDFIDSIGGGGEVGGLVPHYTLLWENPYSSNPFSAQTITIPDFSDFDFLEINCRGGSQMGSFVTKFHLPELMVGNVHWLTFIGQGATGLPSINGRPFNVVSSTQLHFELGAYWNTTGYAGGNANAGVPLQIYGIKYV